MSCGKFNDVDCTAVLEQVQEYLHSEVDEEALTLIHEHLVACGPCLSEYGLEQVRTGTHPSLVHLHPGSGSSAVVDRDPAVRIALRRRAFLSASVDLAGRTAELTVRGRA